MYVTERLKKCNDDERENNKLKGAIAQLGERMICIHEVRGSIPRSSTTLYSEREAFLG